MMAHSTLGAMLPSFRVGRFKFAARRAEAVVGGAVGPAADWTKSVEVRFSVCLAVLAKAWQDGLVASPAEPVLRFHRRSAVTRCRLLLALVLQRHLRPLVCRTFPLFLTTGVHVSRRDRSFHRLSLLC